MNRETKAALRDRQNRIDAYVSKLGQDSARRYLAARPRPHKVNWQTIGDALMGATVALLFIFFAMI